METSLSEYENFVSNSDFGNFMQSENWAKVKKGWECERIAVYDNSGNIKGAMQILIKKIPFITSFAYAVRSPVCDCHDLGTFSELIEKAKQVAEKHHCYLLKIDPMIERGDETVIANFQSLGFHYNPDLSEDRTVQSLKHYILDINDKTKEEVFDSFQPKWRYNIRLAERKGVVCHYYDKSKLDDFCMLMKETGKRDGFEIRSKEYFENLLDAFGENARLYLCYAPDGEPISGAIAIRYGKRVSYVYGASGNGHRNLMPNYLMQWTMIQWAIESCCSVYDFMGIPHYDDKTHPNYGVYRFKKGFNGRAVTYIGEFNYIFSNAKYSMVSVAMNMLGYKRI